MPENAAAETTVSDLRARAAARKNAFTALATEAAQDEQSAHAERQRLLDQVADLDALLEELAQGEGLFNADGEQLDPHDLVAEPEATDEPSAEVSETYASRRERLRGQLHLDTED